MITVLVGADDPARCRVMRDAIAGAPDVRVVAYALGADHYAQLSALARPDVAVVDDSLHAATSPTRTTATATLVLTRRRCRTHARQVLGAGADAVLPHDAPPAALLGALRALTAGATMASTPPATDEQHVAPALTTRERDVAAAVVLGWSNAEIADELGVGLETVKTHVSALLRKLDARNRVELAIRAYSMGLGTASPARGTALPRQRGTHRHIPPIPSAPTSTHARPAAHTSDGRSRG